MVFGIVFAVGFVALLGYAVVKRRGNSGGSTDDGGTPPYHPPHDPTRGSDLPW